MILQLTMKATVILLAVLAGAFVLRRSSAAMRHLAQLAGLVGVLLLPALVAGGPQWELPLLGAEPPVATAESPGENRPVAALRAPRSDGRVERAPAVPQRDPASDDDCRCEAEAPAPIDGRADDPAVMLAVASPATDRVAPLPAEESTISAAPLLAWLAKSSRWLGLVWAAGVLLFVARLAVGWLAMTRTAFDATPLDDDAARRTIENCCRRLGIDKSPRVLVSPRIRVPVLWGFVSPTLFLPEAARAWPQGRLRVVVLHELAHLSRRDGLALLLGRLATAAWWFHPVAWIVDRSARRDCERACDDLVLATGEKPSEYAAHLLAIARELPRAAAPAAALAFVSTSQLEGRVRAILQPRARRGAGKLAAVTVLGLVLLALVPVASARIVARDAAAPAPAERVAGIATQDAEAAPVMTAKRTISTGRAAGIAAGKSEYLLAHEGRYHEGEELFERAYEHHREGEYDEAAPLFLEAAEAGYRPSTSLYNAACGYAMQGNASRAIGYIERAIDEGFSDGKLLMGDSDLDPIRGDSEFRALLDRVRADRDSAIGRRTRGLFDDIEQEYQELVDEGSTDGSEWYRVGSRLLQMRQFETSIAALERAADLLENNQNALYNLACAYSLQDDTGAALDHLERAVLAGFSSDERFADDTDLDSVRGTKRFGEIRDLNETLSLDRFQQRFDFWGDNQYSVRRWEPAVEEFTEFTRKSPDIGRGWFNLGWALHHSRRHAEARKAFERQRSLDYRPGNATYNIACTYAMEDNVDAALDALGKAVEMDTVSAGQMLGDDDLESLHDDPRFLELLETAIERDDDEHFDRRKIEQWFREKKDGDRARVH